MAQPVLSAHSYGRLTAILASRCGDLALAEDALADACLAALEQWGETRPANSDAWLLTVARRRLVDRMRRDTLRVYTPWLDDEADPPDQRLALLLVCAHPAIDPAARAPLMLQTVLGLDAARIAGAFLVPATTMSQRLVRAKLRIRELRVPFSVPDDPRERIDDVLDAIYTAFTSGRDEDLVSESLFLAELVAERCPDHAEARGLAALLLHVAARSAARRAEGAYVPLDEQDPERWDVAKISRAEAHLRAAAALEHPGRFQLEAAIQSVHNARGLTGRTEWGALLTLYTGLCAIAPSIGAEVGRAAVLTRVNPEAALRALDLLPVDRVGSYQAYWATRAAVLQRLGLPSAEAYERAAGLATDPAVRAFLLARRRRD